MADDISDRDLEGLAEALGQHLLDRGLQVSCAESCTGGWLAQVITAVAGSSQWFERGFITYSNQAKQEMLGVPSETLAAHGAVSEAVVRAMSEGGLEQSSAQLCVAITGIAGPDGGSVEKPVGTVWFGWAASREATRCERHVFTGDRQTVRRKAVKQALLGLLERLD